MTERRLLIYSYISCAALAVGSLGPWVSGPLRASGASTGGILTLFGAGLSALTIWWWTVSQRQSILIVARVFAALCAAVAIYAVYDIRDFYIDADEIWIARVGWGLILALIAAVALTVLCFFLYRRTRLRRKGQPKIWLLAATVAAALALGFWIVPVVESDPMPEPVWFGAWPKRTIPTYALEAAAGRFGGATGGVWLFGRGGNNCWATKTVEDRFPSGEGALGSEESATCGMVVPPAYWRLAALGPLGDRDSRRTLLFFLTRLDVASLNVLIGHRLDRERGQFWIRAKTQVITQSQARKARLHRNFGYAVAQVPGEACVKRVAVFGWSGKRIRRTSSLPCKT